MRTTRLGWSLLVALILLLAVPTAQAGLRDKLKKKVNDRVEKTAEDKVDEALDSAEDALSGDGEASAPAPGTASAPAPGADAEAAEAPRAELTWAKFDFLPGDKVIFEDAPSPDEENGEFPSRWDLVKGNVEIAEFNGETVIYFLDGGDIVPYLKGSDKPYLPEVFTLEFDCYFDPKVHNQGYGIYLYDLKNQKRVRSVMHDISIWANAIEFMDSEMSYPGAKRSNWRDAPTWRHISLAYTRGKLKVYMDDTRLINIPHLDGTPVGITLHARTEATNRFIRNVRLAEGGVKYYDRVLQDGKIVVTGIKFDVNKATLKPESMGPINEIHELMVKKPDLRFSVEGHTDSDGEDAANQSLSEQRAAAVAAKLQEMGIAADRLTAKGWGESKPMDSNATAEGRANNRRVEFVKF
jgi:OOP family OmpA-OmpF porin